MTNENLVTIDIDDDETQHYMDETAEMQQQTSQGLSLMPEVCVYENQQHLHDETETLLNEHQPLLDHHDHFQAITYNQFPGMSTVNSCKSSHTARNYIKFRILLLLKPRNCAVSMTLIVLPYLKRSMCCNNMFFSTEIDQLYESF